MTHRVRIFLLGFALALHSIFPLHGASVDEPTTQEKTNESVQFFLPGFSVRELPVDLSNLNNVEYAPDGRLFAAGYDGRIHVLRDTDGDGLEDAVTTFGSQPGGDYPLGM